MSRSVPLFLGSLLLFAPAIASAEETQRDKCDLQVTWKSESEAVSLDVFDARRFELSRPLARVRSGDAGPAEIPCSPMLLLWRGKTGGAAAETIDAPPGQRLAVQAPARVIGGAALVRVERTRATREASLEEVRLKGADTKPFVSDGLDIFNGLPFGSELELAAPKSLCLDTPVKAKVSRTDAVASVAATICQCSDLRITLESERLNTLLPISLSVRRSNPPLSGDISPIQAETTIEAVDPVFLRGIPPGDYVLETSIRSLGFVRHDELAVPFEGSREHTLSLDFLSVSGAATYGGEPAQGELTFHRRMGTHRFAVSTPLGEAGSFHALVPEPGKYSVQLHRGREAAPGPSRFVEIPAKRESTVDVAFDRSALSVRIVDAEGRPISSARVEVLVQGDDKTTTQQIGYSDANGQALFEDLQPGQVRLSGHRAGYRPLTDPLSFRLEKEQPTERTVTFRRVATARLTALDSSSSPISGVDLVCAPAASLLQVTDEGRTDDAGSLDIDVEDRLPLRCGLATNRAAMAQMTLQSAQPLTLRMTSNASTLVVTFVDQDGKPVAGQVVLLRIDGEFVMPDLLELQQAYWGGQIRSDGGGSLRFLGLPGGTVDVCHVSDRKSFLEAVAGGDVERLARIALAPGESRKIVVHLARK